MSSAWKNAFALTLLTIPMAECLATCPTVSEWNVNGNGDWGIASDWSNNCVPNGLGDSALLGLFPTVPVTINLDINPTITTLTFDNQNGYTINNLVNVLNFQDTGGSGHTSITNLLGTHVFNAQIVIVFDDITIKASDPSGILSIRRGISSVGIPNLTFNGPGTLINDSLSSTPSLIQIPLGILTINSGEFINDTTVTPAVALGSLVIAGEFIQNGGLFENANTAAILVNSRRGSVLNVFNSFTLNSGTFSNFNIGSIGTGFIINQIFGSDVFVNNNLTINNGRLENINQGSVAGAISAGTRIRAGNVIINNGVLHNQNDGPITGNTVVGSTILSTGLMTFNNGRVENINTSSSIFPDVMNVGSLIGVGGFIMQDGILKNTNSGSFSSANGAEFDFNGAATINGGTINNANTGNLASNLGFTNGAILSFAENLHMTDGSLVNINSGSIQGNSIGSVVVQVFQDSTIDGGSIINTNSGNVGPGVGLSFASGAEYFFSNNFIQNKGTITNINSGQVSGPNAIGALFRSFNHFQMNGGTFTNRNEGPIFTDGIGSLLRANSIDITGGIVTNDNIGTVSPDPSIGSLIQTPTLNISNGILINNDTVQANTVTNQALGIIAGTGVFENFITLFLQDPAPTIVFTNGGTVIPGDPFCGDPGTMTILGTYIQKSHGTLQINLKNASTFSKLHVSGIPGTANLNGTLKVALADQANGFPGHHITILDATGGVFGTFSKIIDNLPSTLKLGVEYFPNSVDLTLDPTVADYFGGFTQALFTTVNQINNRLGWQMESVKRRMPKWDSEKCCYPDTNPWEIYIGPLGSIGHLNHEKDQVGARFTTIGGLIGIDYAMCEFGVGLEADYEHIHAHGHDQWGKVDIDEAHASLYATYVPTWQPELAVNAIVGGGYEWYSFHRKTHVGQLVAKGSPKGSEFDALFGIEYDIGLSMNCNKYHLIPLASVQYILLNIDKYTEHKADEFDMKFGHQRAKSLRSTLGFRSNYSWECEDFSFVPEITLAWQREFLDKGRDVDFTPVFFDLPGSSLQMAHAGRNIWMGGIDLQATFCGNYGVEASYNFEWNKRYTNNFFYLGFKYSF